jgi:hypothetical protein
MSNVYEDILNGKLKFEDFKGIMLVASFEREIDDYEEMTLFELKGEDYTKENLKQEMRENCMEIFYGFHDNDNTFFRVLQDHVSWESWLPLLNIKMVFILLNDAPFRRNFETYQDFLEYEHQYQYHHSVKMNDVFEELIEKAWHPSRVFQWCV